MQQFGWQGFELALPEDWECVRFSKNRARGECAFADREGPRLSFTWSEAAAGADTRKLLEELIRQVRKADPSGGVVPEEWEGPAPWRGFLWQGGERLLVAVAHLTEAGYLAKVQFVRRETANPKLEARVLAGVRWQGRGGDWAWRAFGCRVRLPSEFRIAECEVVPGKATLGFRGPGRGGDRFRLQRLAMPEACLKGRDFPEWYRANLRDGKVTGAVAAEMRGHRASRIETVLPPATAWQRLLRRKRRGTAVVWVCEKEERLYCAEWERTGNAAPPEIERIVECA